MSKEVAELIGSKLARKFNTHKSGMAFREARVLPELQKYDEGQIRNGLDAAVKLGYLRKIAHKTLTLRDGKTSVIAFTGVENPNTNDEPDYSLKGHPQFLHANSARIQNAKNGNGTPRAKHVGKVARDFVALIESSEGIDRHNLVAQGKAILGLSEPTISYQIGTALKRGDIVAVGNRLNRIFYSAEFRRNQELEQAKKDHAPREVSVEEAVDALADSDVVVHPVFIPHAKEAAPVSEDISHHLRGIANAMADTLSQYLVERMAANLSQFVSAFDVPAINPQAFREAVDVAMAKPQAREKKQKVVVIGLLPSQAGMMQSEFMNRLDLQFIEVDDMTRARAAAGHADKVVGMTKFINHPIEGQVKDHPGYVRISGGLTQLRQKLQNFAAQAAH